MLSGNVCSLHAKTVHSQSCIPVSSVSAFCRRPTLCPKLRHSGSKRGSPGKQGRQPSVQVCAAQSRPLSFNQRWRSFKGTAEEQAHKAQEAVRALPPVQALFQFLQIVREKADPFFRVLHIIEDWMQAWQTSYAEFGGDEVKRLWEWKRRSVKEWDLWVSILKFVRMSFLTAFWMGITPVSVFWGAFVPATLSWILYDNQLQSPIFWTLVPLLFFKFPPGYPVKLF